MTQVSNASNTGNDLTVIIDTGCANLSSVRFAFERLNANVIVSADFDVIRSAARVVLPGVGTAGAAMDALKQKNLIELIKSLTQPVMGVCLGMQMLASLSNEHGGRSEQNITCLGLVPTDIGDLDSKGLPLPHMGWNQIEVSDHPLFVGIENGSYVYFVHSYRAPISEYTLASSTYGESFSAAIGKGNFFGVQFHPEKSAKVGAKILQNFLQMGLNMGAPQ
ncbi:imidazole glycerol phosphate synthase subunit HisH [Shewanella frigidimarina]|jgi:glutamine amidotransferase|uniref:Imidazole glycerol phosphate synthase subunit HisH n=1 Tax=Shewanella frigidimarina (strain NCIMB 400) TaxID=318167 RepID=Q083J9_SHEFN|nr:imidazole glycerol phosphate synthase subunit HisH [Shewanella frigidimarina]ABI71566.1 imidazole glycerol phosphate synthase subunit hisH [Shewanella frigidimarina NCIMB 400]MBB1381128.1 imidazole glycerol phosphate synthase subunit HisH [Shewanella sp. SR41-2]RPA59309.1 imidazole glycerol phosphate synthase subunit HisH [Shewanella frigidimarina]|tara:strand:- start:1764 stop:2426 length:663 start_codon:yes stop_codon:yes gene_type:complete